MKRIHLYFRIQPPKDYFLPGDRHVIALLKKALRREKISGVRKVFLNLCKGLDQLHVDYDINLPFRRIQEGEPVVVLGDGKYSLTGYNKSNPIIAGIALMTHPSDWPELIKEYPVAKYLQHSEWARNLYVPYFGSEVCAIWPSGVDTRKWDHNVRHKTFDILIYNKIRWNTNVLDQELRLPLIAQLDEAGLHWREINYGSYAEPDYYELLRQCQAMIFLCEHESQGLALCEAMSMNVPIFAWDQGFCLDPHRFAWNDPIIPATSVPYFNERCGMRFKDIAEFNTAFIEFWAKVKEYGFSPRSYILENLTLKKSAQKMLEVIKTVYR